MFHLAFSRNRDGVGSKATGTASATGWCRLGSVLGTQACSSRSVIFLKEILSCNAHFLQCRSCNADFLWLSQTRMLPHP